MHTPEYLLENNTRRAEEMKAKKAQVFFVNLRRVTAEIPVELEISTAGFRLIRQWGFKPGELFVHRNISDVVVHGKKL